MNNEAYSNRRYVISAVAIFIASVFILQLFNLQIIDKSTKDKADTNALLKQTLYPSRGLIYDRNKKLLVYNQPIYDITMIFNEMGKEFDTIAFCKTINISREEFDNRVKEIKSNKRGYSRFVAQLFDTQLYSEDIAQLQQTLYKFPGIYIRKRTIRDYTFANGAQVIGSIGEVSQKMIDNDSYYAPGDYIGREGIERTYEKYLRGEKGVEILLRDSKGRIQGKYEGGAHDIPPVSGGDLTLTLDIKLQQVAEELLEGKIGSAVAIEPKSGEILALASSPTWDPKLLVGKNRSKNYNALSNNPNKPLYNRATQATYPPGSTFKTVQALIGLQEKTITPNTMFSCQGKQSKPISCTHAHGSPVNLISAIEQSCNPYFWKVYEEMLDKGGYGKNNENFRKNYLTWRNNAMSFGLGTTFTGSDLPSQSSGTIPSAEFYDKRYKGKTNWKSSTIRSNSIGQGEILVTPLQLCNVAATIANEGYYITPHINKVDSLKTNVHHTNIDKQYFAIVKEGMLRVMKYGTGRSCNIDSLKIGGKTGTAQVLNKKDNAIFIGIAPIDDPKIAVAVVVENAGFGATWACPVATMMMEQYLTGEVKRRDLRKRIGSAVLNESVKKW